MKESDCPFLFPPTLAAVIMKSICVGHARVLLEFLVAMRAMVL